MLSTLCCLLCLLRCTALWAHVDSHRDAVCLSLQLSRMLRSLYPKIAARLVVVGDYCRRAVACYERARKRWG